MGARHLFLVGSVCAGVCAAAMHSSAQLHGVAIEHKPVACLIADRYPVLQARLDPADAVGRARVLFRAAGTPSWYFVDMKREKQVFLGTLPKPLKSTTRIEYYIEVADRSLDERRTPDYTPSVVGGSSECGPNMLTAVIVTSAKIAVGSLAPGVTALPAGFSSVGIAGGSLTGIAAGAGGAAGGGGLSTGVVLGIVGAGAAVAGGVAFAAKGGSSPSTAPPATTPAVGQPSPTPTATPTPAPTPTPTPVPPTTTTPAGPNLTGTWVGSLIVTQGIECEVETDITLTLTQSGGNVGGTAAGRTRRLNPARPNCTARQDQWPLTGSIAGNAVALAINASADEGPFAVMMTGTLSGSRMSGNWTCGSASFACNQSGIWDATRQ